MTEMTDQELQQQLMETYRAEHQEVKASSMTARLGNVLYWAFSGFAVLLLLVAVMFAAIGGSPDYRALLFTLAVFGISTLVSGLLGHACRYVLGGDAALWERALIGRARRSQEFQVVCGTVALFAVSGVAWLVYDAHYQETLRKQQYQQRQADERREARQAEAERQAEAHEAAQRQAAIAAQQAAAEREAAAERAAVISATNVSISNVSLDSIYATYDQVRGTITNHSAQTLRYLEFEGTIKDCRPEYDADQCGVMGQLSVKLTVDIQPNQARAFIAHLGSWNLPDRDPQHHQFSSWRIVTASSCSQVNLSAHKCAKANLPSDKPQECSQGLGPPEPQTASQSSPPLANDRTGREDRSVVTGGWIGMEVQPITPEIADAMRLKKAAGALVARPQADGPAGKAGIENGDVITAVNGKPVNPGTTVALDLIHDGQQKTVSLTLGTRPN